MNRDEQSAFKPNYAISPGETLSETLETLEISQTQLAERMGRPKKTVSEIVAGKAAITAETALQLERVLGVPASFWSNLERNYRETLERLEEEQRLSCEVGWLEKFPLAVMIRNGWLRKEKSPVGQLQAMLSFFGVAGVDEWERLWQSRDAAFRNSTAFQANPFAVAAWLRKGEMDARNIACQAYNRDLFRKALEKIRALSTRPPEIFEPKLKELCLEAGVAVVFVPRRIGGTHVFGATRWLTPTKALIQLSLHGKSDDHLWFTFFHEAGHILLHGKKEVFIEATGGRRRDTGGAAKEKEADVFAGEQLIPSSQYQAFVQRGHFALSAIQEFARGLGITPGIVVGRLQHDERIPYSWGNTLKKRFQFRENKSEAE